MKVACELFSLRKDTLYLLVLGLDLLNTHNVGFLRAKPLKKPFAGSRADAIEVGRDNAGHGASFGKYAFWATWASGLCGMKNL